MNGKARAGGLSCPFIIEKPDYHSPFVYNSPHSGRIYPAAFLQASRLDSLTLRKSEDAFVEELFRPAVKHGAAMIHAQFPRAYLDVNREPFELDPQLFDGELPSYANTGSIRVIGGLGTIARIVTESEEIYREAPTLEEALERIRHLHQPYHKALSGLLNAARRRHGLAILIDCHSMPSAPAMYGHDKKPDFVLGDRFGSSCASTLTNLASNTLNELGYSVTLNKPYAGGYITEHYGQPPKNVHALQIEINRSLYMDEDRFLKTARFSQIQEDMEKLTEVLHIQLPQDLQPSREAAE